MDDGVCGFEGDVVDSSKRAEGECESCRVLVVTDNDRVDEQASVDGRSSLHCCRLGNVFRGVHDCSSDALTPLMCVYIESLYMKSAYDMS